MVGRDPTLTSAEDAKTNGTAGIQEKRIQNAEQAHQSSFGVIFGGTPAVDLLSFGRSRLHNAPFYCFTRPFFRGTRCHSN
jgi:hypothetical protein